ncbi:MAG: M20 family metallopeptidase, partial [Candidatus Limnocylindrales bacterium]
MPAGAQGAADAVDRVRLLGDLRALVRIPSVTGSEEAVSDWLTGALRGIPGVAVERLAPDPATIRADPDWPGEEMDRTTLPLVIGRLGRTGGRRVVLVGHTDVVPPGDPATWSVDPWAGRVSDGDLYGRGACDMKGGVAAILAAIRGVVDAGLSGALAGEVVVAFVPSEEDGGQGMLAAIRAGVTGDLAVITEPSNLDVVVAHAGAITFRLTVPGRAAHASQRREGVSALDKLWVLSRALDADETRR